MVFMRRNVVYIKCVHSSYMYTVAESVIVGEMLSEENSNVARRSHVGDLSRIAACD